MSYEIKRVAVLPTPIVESRVGKPLTELVPSGEPKREIALPWGDTFAGFASKPGGAVDTWVDFRNGNRSDPQSVLFRDGDKRVHVWGYAGKVENQVVSDASGQRLESILDKTGNGIPDVLVGPKKGGIITQFETPEIKT